MSLLDYNMRQTFILLLVASLVVVSSFAASTEDATTSIVDEAVVTLTGGNFSSFIRKNEFTLVEFYAPWCGHCKKLAPEYEQAAKLLKVANGIPLAKVDATKDEDLAKKYDIAGYPTLKFFRRGKPEEYKGGRTAQSIVQWIEAMTGPAVRVAPNKDDAMALANKAVTAFVAGLKSEDTEESKLLTEVADEYRHIGKFIAYVDANAQNDIVAYRSGEQSLVAHPLDTKENVEKFCLEERFPYFGPIDSENYNDYFATGRQMVWFASEREDYDNSKAKIMDVAKILRSSHNFVWFNTEIFKEHAQTMLGIKEFPGLVLQTKDGRYVYPSSKFEAEPITAFLKNAADGKVEKFYKSDDVPMPSTEVPQVVVGKTFKKMVLQKDKDVILEVYAPWCGHCKKLEPIYREFAKKMAVHKNLLVAKLDGTTNEAPVPGFEWSGFPSIYFVKAGTDTPIVMEGDRTMDALTEFVESHLTKALDVDGGVKTEL